MSDAKASFLDLHLSVSDGFVKSKIYDKRDLVGCFGFNGSLRQYFSLYRAVSQREGERKRKGR